MDQPPAPAMNPTHNSAYHASYADSVESSPRSRTTETWDDREPFPAAAVHGGGGKVRLMCSYGGHIIPRPHDKSLSYVGGDTRMVVVDRNISLGELKSRISKNLFHSHEFTLKYQLPSEDLDSLISVTSDEDLENMIDEFDRICATSSAAKSCRLRVFLFPNSLESASSMELIMGGSAKSEDWFYNVLNNGSKASANSFLGFQNDGGNMRPGNSKELEADLNKNQKGNNQDADADSVMIDNSSSFGSTTSSSLANLPPIRVRVEAGGGGGGGNKVQDQRVSVEEQFPHAHMGKQDEGFAAMASPRIQTTFMPATMNLVMGVGELSERIVSDDDKRSEQGVPVEYGRTQTHPLLHAQSQPPQKQNGMFDIASPNSGSSDGSMLYQDPGINLITSNSADFNNPGMQGQPKVTESGNLSHSQLEQRQLQQQLHQLQQQQHQQNQRHQQHQNQQQQNRQNQQQQQQNHNQQQHEQHQQQQQQQQHQQHQQQQEHLLQQQQQEQEHLQQQQQQQNQQQQQQQHQQQQQQHHQFVHPGTQYIQHPQNAVPMSQYYHLYPPPKQQRQQQLDQQQYPFYFVHPTARQPQQAYNMSLQQATYSEPSNAAPSSRPHTLHMPTMTANSSVYNNQSRTVALDNSEMASKDYRTAIPNAQSMVQVAPGQHQQQYMSYSQNPASVTNSSYAYEYSDPGHVQMYSTQPPAHPYGQSAQYQTMASSSPLVMQSDASSGQNPNDNMKHHSSPRAQ